MDAKFKENILILEYRILSFLKQNFWKTLLQYLWEKGQVGKAKHGHMVVGKSKINKVSKYLRVEQGWMKIGCWPKVSKWNADTKFRNIHKASKICLGTVWEGRHWEDSPQSGDMLDLFGFPTEASGHIDQCSETCTTLLRGGLRKDI